MNTQMNPAAAASNAPQVSREALVHQLYEAAELEHNLMCTYLYAAFSLKSGVEEGLSAAEAAATGRWRRAILKVAVEEMGHLCGVEHHLGWADRRASGRLNFPLDPGGLPANVVVRLAPFSEPVLQHFIYLNGPFERTRGRGFAPEFQFTRRRTAARHAMPSTTKPSARSTRPCPRISRVSWRAWARNRPSAVIAACRSHARKSTFRVAIR